MNPNGRTAYPFAPTSVISREQLLAYAEGRLSSRQEHEVEMHLAEDTLLGEFVEGIALPGARDGLHELDRNRPTNGAGPASWIPVLIILVSLIGIATLVMDDPDHELHVVHGTTIAQEIMDPIVPADDRIGPTPEQDPSIRSENTIGAVARTEVINSAPLIKEYECGEPVIAEWIERRPIELPVVNPSPAAIKRSRISRSGLQLHYLHDLKILHPKEMYLKDRMPEQRHLPASAEIPGNAANQNDVEVREYLAVMDEALGHFSRDEFQKCLIVLDVVLEEFPEDVNAHFYSGMSRLHLGAYHSASFNLKKAREHEAGVFTEEAQWYYALSQDAAGATDAARSLYEHIAERGGFYAERASEKLAE